MLSSLAFAENCVVLAHPSKSGEAWWYGTLVLGGKKGFFPNAYVQVMDNGQTLLSAFRAISHTDVIASSDAR